MAISSGVRPAVIRNTRSGMRCVCPGCGELLPVRSFKVGFLRGLYVRCEPCGNVYNLSPVSYGSGRSSGSGRG
jgi:uncharacterized protein (DUF983 family)